MSGTVVKELELATLARGAAPKGERLGERLDLVEHIKVQLSISLGGAEIDVGRLFALGAGELVVLDRDVDAPVDVRLGDKVIARGELVAAGDRFAVRITEISAD
jgi:flagellar motor switch protein FliN/FliY